jgi:hypothetical protein
MHFSEDELREALKRKDPGEGFSQRVMARVSQAQSESARPSAKVKKSNGSFMAWWQLRPAWAVAVVAILLLAFGVAGYQYSEYRHKEEMEIARHKQEQFQKEAEQAKQQAILALEIARSKLNHVLERAQLPVEDGNEKIRRQRL